MTAGPEGILLENLRLEDSDSEPETILVKARASCQSRSRVLDWLSDHNNEARTSLVRQNITDHTAVQDRRIEDLERRLANAREDVKFKTRTIQSQDRKMATLEGLLDFKQEVRCRCFHAYRRDTLNRDLTDEEQETILSANELVHGGDCVVDMTYVAGNQLALYYEDYQRLYGIHPEVIFRHQPDSNLTTTTTDMVGSIAMNDRLSDFEIEEFRKAGQLVQSSIMYAIGELDHDPNDADEASLFLGLKECYEELAKKARSQRTNRGRRKFENSSNAR